FGPVLEMKIAVSRHPGQVFQAVGGVDDDPEVVHSEPIDDQIVEDAALLVAHQGVLRATGSDPGQVIREKALKLSFSPVTADIDATHVAQIEEAGDSAHR